MNEPRVLIVVATLGQRPEYLSQTLDSIRSQAVPSDVLMVAPLDSRTVQEAAQKYAVAVLPDPGSLPGAINLGAQQLKSHHEYFNWLNDDDPQGRELWISRAGKWAPRVLPWGPDLIPQPGMLVRSSSWRQVGGLDESYRLAFDLDLLLKLKKHGRLVQVPSVVSAFRWHPDSLTVDDRGTNIRESERAKRAALSPRMRRFAWLWEPPVRLATRMAAREVQRRARRMSAG